MKPVLRWGSGVILQVVALVVAVRTVAALGDGLGPVELLAMAVVVMALVVAGRRLCARHPRLSTAP